MKPFKLKDGNVVTNPFNKFFVDGNIDPSDYEANSIFAAPGIDYAWVSEAAEFPEGRHPEITSWSDNAAMEQRNRALHPASAAIADAAGKEYPEVSAATRAGRAVREAVQSGVDKVNTALQNYDNLQSTYNPVYAAEKGAAQAMVNSGKAIMQGAKNLGTTAKNNFMTAASNVRDFTNGVLGRKEGGIISYLDYIK